MTTLLCCFCVSTWAQTASASCPVFRKLCRAGAGLSVHKGVNPTLCVKSTMQPHTLWLMGDSPYREVIVGQR